ncbi:MAG: DMT family transporter [Betaproteobacteria bacterium]
MPPRKLDLDALAVASLLACSALWGLNQVVIKLSVPHIPPLALSGLRSLLTALLVLLWCTYRGIALFRADGTLKAGLLVGACYAGTVAFTYLGLTYTSASRLGVFLYLSPFMVAMGMPLIEKNERLSLLQMGGLLVAFGGMGLAFADNLSGPAPPDQWLGDLMGAVSAVFWALTILVMRGSRLNQISPEKSVLYQAAFSVPLLALSSALAGESMRPVWTLELAALVGYQCVVVTFASMLLWYWLLRRYPAAKMSVFTLLTPVFGLLASVVVLDEPLTVRLLLALVTIAVGLLMVNRREPPVG